MKLEIILRTCLRSKLDAGVDPAFVRICGPDRREMVLKCLKSLVISANQAQITNPHHQIKLTVLDDNSDADFLDDVRSCLGRGIFPWRIEEVIVPDGVASFNQSAFEQFKRASESEELVYSVEDDYLHTPEAISAMLTAYTHFTSRFPSDTPMIFPFDCPFRYEQGREEPTILFHDGVRYWRQVGHTTNTFLTHAQTIRKHFHTFAKLALEYPAVNEQHTINQLYKKFLSPSGSITVYNPIPSVAYHLSYAAPVEIKTELNWRDLWDAL